MAASMVATVSSPQTLSRPAYFFLHREEAARAHGEKQDGTFSERNCLLRELGVMFDWMAQDPIEGTASHDIIRRSEDTDERPAGGVKRMSLRKFKRRLPEIHRKFPLLASSFKRMDTDDNCWLDYEEFVDFFLKDRRLQEKMRRSMVVQVYGLDSSGNRVYKDDLSHMCEMGTPMPMLPWETAQVVEWRIEGLKLSYKGSPTIYAGMEVRAGTSIASPPFRAAGVCGFLRFWPRGYWTESKRLRKASAAPGLEPDRQDVGSPGQLPGPDSWCCIGACMPVGTHLALRFFVEDDKSERKECYWCEGISSAQIWAPAVKVPPQTSNILVGIEILQNFDSTDSRSSAGSMRPTKRLTRRPFLKTSPMDTGCVQNSVFLGASRSMPDLAKLPKKLPKPAAFSGTSATVSSVASSRSSPTHALASRESPLARSAGALLGDVPPAPGRRP